MAAGPVGVTHPAKTMFLMAFILAFLAWILNMIAVFVPWSWRDVAVYNRWWVSLWQNCLRITNAWLHDITCYRNDVNQVGSVAGGSLKCRGYFVATQVFVLLALGWGFLGFVLAALILGKLWSKPILLAFYVCACLFIAFSTALVSFLVWIVYAETSCQVGSAYWPVKGYSWGWICMIVATFLYLLAMLLAYLGLLKILTFKPFIPYEEPPVYPTAEAAPVYVEQPYYVEAPAAYEAPAYTTPMAYPQASYPSPYGY
jgi:hypothetical protein